MISFGNAASSHSGLIPLNTAYKKRGELLWAIARKKNFINPHSAAFVTVCIRNLVHTYKCHALIKFVQTLPRLRQLWQVHTPLSDFFKKLLVQRNTKINEKCNGVITLLWPLRLQENPVHKKVSSLCNTAMVTFFPCLNSRQHS